MSAAVLTGATSIHRSRPGTRGARERSLAEKEGGGELGEGAGRDASGASERGESIPALGSFSARGGGSREGRDSVGLC